MAGSRVWIVENNLHIAKLKHKDIALNLREILQLIGLLH